MFFFVFNIQTNQNTSHKIETKVIFNTIIYKNKYRTEAIELEIKYKLSILLVPIHSEVFISVHI